MHCNIALGVRKTYFFIKKNDSLWAWPHEDVDVAGIPKLIRNGDEIQSLFHVGYE